MAAADAVTLERLWRGRFAEVPFDCGAEAEPGIDEVEEWRDWDERDTTADQRRIEEYLERRRVKGMSILHVGVGNSKLALRFGGTVEYVLGTTISAREKRHGDALNLANYDVRVHNKYAQERVRGRAPRFDIIIDNNPTTFCCCWRHASVMMGHYAAMLKPSGQLLTDKVGLGWIVSAPDANPRWRFSYDDWEALGDAHGLEACREDDFVYSLSPRSRRAQARKLLARLGGRALRRLRASN